MTKDEGRRTRDEGRRTEQLKKLQDNLGDFNDLCVQEEYLLHMTQKLLATPQQRKKTQMAIVSLTGTLDRERQAVKDAFAKTFTDFASPANRKLFRELFTLKPGEKNDE